MSYKNKILPTLALAAVSALYACPSFANIIYDSTQHDHGTGFGTQDNILTIQAPGGKKSDGIETGKVAWNGTNDVYSGDDVDTNSNKTATFTFGDLGITNAGQILLTWNPNEPGNTAGDDTRIDQLILSIYSPSGSEAFSDSLASPVLHESLSNPGLGGDDFAYVLDDNGISDLNSVLSGISDFSDYRLGLESTVGLASAGPDTWTIGSRPFGPGTGGGTPVPEPTPVGLLGLALIGMALAHRYMSRQRG